MQTETTQPASANQNISFGTRLKTAREALGLERKDIAAQLRLNEKYLIMMEKDRFAPDVPLTFARGYLKSYAKFLQIPEYETKKALETLKPGPGSQDGFSLPNRNMPNNANKNSYTQLFTYLVIFSVVGFGGAWWYNHPEFPNSVLSSNMVNFAKKAIKDNMQPAANTAQSETNTLPIANANSNDPQPESMAPTAPAQTTAAVNANDDDTSTLAPGTSIDNEPSHPAIANSAPANKEDIDAQLANTPSTTNAAMSASKNTHASNAAPAYMADPNNRNDTNNNQSNNDDPE